MANKKQLEKKRTARISQYLSTTKKIQRCCGISFLHSLGVYGKGKSGGFRRILCRQIIMTQHWHCFAIEV